MNLDLTLEAMSEAARLLREGFDVREKLHAIQKAQDALDGVKAALLSELGVSRSHEVDGASTLNAWVRHQLRMNAGQASVLVRNAQAIRDLPLVAEAALSGRISAAHVQAFVYGIKHVGLELMRLHEQTFVEVALVRDPGELFEAVKYLRAEHRRAWLVRAPMMDRGRPSGPHLSSSNVALTMDEGSR